MISFTEIELHHQWIGFNEKELTHRGIKTPSHETLIELIAADNDNKLREFTAQWFPFMSYMKSWEHPDFEEEVKAVSDTRELMLLVLELKRMVDESSCTREAFEALGVTFGPGGTEKHEQACLNYLASSESFSRYIRKTTQCENVERLFLEHHSNDTILRQRLIDDGYLTNDGIVYCPFASLSFASKDLILKDHLFLCGQEEKAEGLDPEKSHPVMNFFGGNLGKSISYSKERAFFFIDSIFRDCIQGLRIQTNDGILTPRADTNFTSLWLCLSDSFREARVTACKTCRLPIIVTDERGAKRQYCNNTCKRKFKRALKFASLVNNEGMDLQGAAKASGMSAATAMRILEYNDISMNSSK